MPTPLRERPKPFLLPEFCKGCGRCIDSCAKHCIEPGSEIDPLTGLVPVTLNLDACNACGLCMDACPEPYGLRPQVEGADFELLRTRVGDSGGRVTYRSFAGLNHLFQNCTTGAISEYGQIDETIAPSALRLISKWIQLQTKR